MDAILSILRAAHCRSTHHYFAIDAIQEVTTMPGQRLGNLLLAHFSKYLLGAKDPDTSFKDFENHVVHVQQNYWGGAAKTAEKWLLRVRKQLADQQWSDAAYSIGVLSHYFTDPLMPLHTGQTPRETIVHRPLEWSVCCSYEAILQIAMQRPDFESFELPSGPSWMTDAVHLGAAMANPFYQSLIDDYVLAEAHRNPTLALTTQCKESLARIFVWALTGWGAILDRIASELNADIPMYSLALPTLMATIQTPSRKVSAILASMNERREVGAILEEVQQTGKLVRHLPNEQKVVAAIRAQRPQLHPAAHEVERAQTLANLVVSRDAQRKAVSMPMPADTHESSGPTREPDAIPTATRKERQPVAYAKRHIRTPKQPERTTSPALPLVATSSPAARENGESPSALARSPRMRLTLESPVVDAPAIGPKTAARLTKVGVVTVGDLINRDCDGLATELASSWVTAKVIRQWQAQARLACEIAGLTSAGAGLLALVGFESAQQIKSHPPSHVHDLVCKAAETSEGQRVLRSLPPPPLTTVEKWFRAAAG
jgi:hypothetical protein